MHLVPSEISSKVGKAIYLLFGSPIRITAKRAAINAMAAPKEKAHSTPIVFQRTPMRRLAGRAATPIEKW
jgi:hypothetical protein